MNNYLFTKQRFFLLLIITTIGCTWVTAQTTVTLEDQCNCEVLKGTEVTAPGDTVPTGAELGDLYVNTDTGAIYFWDGDSWEIANDATGQWQDQVINGRNTIVPKQAWANGDTLAITDEGQLIRGTLAFIDSTKAIHNLPTYRAVAGDSDTDKYTEIATEYRDTIAGAILKADGGLELYRTKDIHSPMVMGYIDFHKTRDADNDIRILADTTQVLYAQKASFNQSINLTDELNPGNASYYGGLFNMNSAETFTDDVGSYRGLEANAFRDGTGNTTGFFGGLFRAREEAAHTGEITNWRGLGAYAEKFGQGNNVGTIYGLESVVSANNGASGTMRFPIGANMGVSINNGSNVGVTGYTRGFNAFVNINNPSNGTSLGNVFGGIIGLNSNQVGGTHQQVTEAEILRLGHNANFASQGNLFGLRITGITGGLTNNYAIYTDAGNIRFGDVPLDPNPANDVVVRDASGVLRTITQSQLAANNNNNPWDNPDGTVADQSSVNINYPNGNVGIGRISPVATLDVAKENGLGTTAGSENLLARFTENIGNQLNFEIKSMRDADGSTWPNTRTRLEYNVDRNAGKKMYMEFINENSDTSNNNIAFGEGSGEWMRMSNGRLGIGTTAPTNQLHLSGGTNPIRLEGLQDDANPANKVVVADANGVLKTTDAGAFNNNPWDNPDGSVADQSSTTIGYTGGNVGVGTLNPTTRFEIASEIAPDDRLAFYSDANNRFRIQTLLDGKNLTEYPYGGGSNRLSLQPKGGFVGIGIEEPQVQLHVNNSMMLEAAGNAIMTINGKGTGDFNGNFLNMDISPNAGYENFARFLFTFNKGTTASPSLSLQRRTADNQFRGSIISYDDDEGLRFYSASDPTVGTTQRMEIAEDGNVGINVLNPTNRLHVEATSDPLRLVGLQDDTNPANKVVVADATGVLKTIAAGDLASGEWEDDGAGGIRAKQAFANGDSVTLGDSGTFQIFTDEATLETGADESALSFAFTNESMPLTTATTATWNNQAFSKTTGTVVERAGSNVDRYMGSATELIIDAGNTRNFDLLRGISSWVRDDSNTAIGTINAANAQATKTGGGSVGTLRGVLGTAQNAGAATVTNLIGLSTWMQNTGGGTVTNAMGVHIPRSLAQNTVTNDYGLRIDNRWGGTDNNYGLYIQNATGATNNYAIYTGGGDIRFGGLQDDTNPTNKVVVADATGVLKTIAAGDLASGEWEDDGAGGIRAKQAFVNGRTMTLTDTGKFLIGKDTETYSNVFLEIEGDATDTRGTAVLIKDNEATQGTQFQMRNDAGTGLLMSVTGSAATNPNRVSISGLNGMTGGIYISQPNGADNALSYTQGVQQRLFMQPVTGNLAIGNSTNPTNKLHVVSTSNPVRFEGLQDDTNPANKLVISDADGVLKTIDQASISTTSPIRTEAGDYTVTISDGTILVDATSGDVTVTLPAPSVGKKLIVKKVDTSGNAVVMNGNGVNIDGVPTRTNTVPYKAFVLQSDGANWFIVN